MIIQSAKKKHARALAELIDLAGEGLPSLLWEDVSEVNQSAIDVGVERALRESGGFSYRNAIVCLQADHVAGMILSYKLPEFYENCSSHKYPKVLKPIIELEAMVAGSWYVNAVAVRANFQSMGIGKHLMNEAEKKARNQKNDRVTLIVNSKNIRAVRLYERLGYVEVVRTKQYSIAGNPLKDCWILMLKSLSGQGHILSS